MQRHVTLFSLTVLAACAADTGPLPAGDGLGGKEDGYWGVSVLRKRVEPIEVPDHPVVGASMSTVVAEWLAGAELQRRSEGPCTDSDYDRDGTWLVHVRCVPEREGDWELEMLRIRERGATRISEFGWSMVIADFDLDGRVDAELDEANQIMSHDDNHDGRVDRQIQAIETLPGFRVEGYAAGWSPPRRLANRILEDTDFDGFFDQEAVTGYDAWVCLQTMDGEWACEEPFEGDTDA